MPTILQKGMNLSLSKIAPQLNNVIVAVNWTKKRNDATEFDIDVSAFLLTQQNKVRSDADFIFYNQPKAIDNTIILKNQLFKVAISNLAEDISKISFVLTLANASEKKQFFGMLENIIIEVFNFSDKQKIASYTVEDVNFETAIILGQLYRHNTEWKFKAIGQGYINGLDVLAKNYGVNIEENKSAPENTSKTNATASERFESKKEDLQKTQSQSNSEIASDRKYDFDIHNTDVMTKQESYQPIVEWLKLKKIDAEVNERAMDTSGFFDEIAVALGDNYDLLKIVLTSIKRRQLKGYDKAYIDLSSYNSQNIGVIKSFCKELYDCAFVSKYFYNSNDKKVVLHLQSATKIINFFNGEWLEWYAFMKIAALCHKKQIPFSCTRNMVIHLPNENKYEIDVFFLINDIPLFIECKAGEYREFIDKYSRLRRKMFIEKPYFLFLTLGVDTESVKGLTAMFDITFLNEKILVDYIKKLFFEVEARQ